MNTEELECPFTMEWGLVTPKWAADILANAAPNRKIKEDSVDAYTRDMLTDRWFPNHQGIAFNPDGQLFDGQNRLTAIVRSGRAQYMLLIRYKVMEIEGVKSKPMETFDRGVTRSVADVLRLEKGMQQEANAVAAAALHIARLCVKFPRFQAAKASVPQTLGVIEIFKPQMEWLIKVRTSTKGLRRVELVGTLALAHAVLPGRTEEFYEMVIAGNGATWSPARLLHGALVEGTVGLVDWAQRSATTERQQSGGIVLATLQAHVNGEKLTKLPIEQGPAALEWFRAQLGDKVLAVAALFPMVREEAKPKSTRGKKAAPVPEPVRETRSYISAERSQKSEEPAPKSPPVATRSAASAVEREVSTPPSVPAGGSNATESARRLLQRARK